MHTFGFLYRLIVIKRVLFTLVLVHAIADYIGLKLFGYIAYELLFDPEMQIFFHTVAVANCTQRAHMIGYDRICFLMH